jgi:superfamily II DNA or RNA helicase
MIELWPFQHTITAAVRKAASDGYKKILIQAATGSGKTVVASDIISGAHEKGSEMLFLAHRRELVYQCYDKLSDFGVTSSIIMSGEYADSWNTTQVASIDTLRVRVKKEKIKMPEAKVVFIDECHRSLAKTYLQIIDYYVKRGAVIIGLTATPIRADGKGLGQIYDKMIRGPSVKQLIADGYLVQPLYYAPTVPDLTGVKSHNDYVEGDLQRAMDKPELVGDVVTNWLRIASDRKTVVFAAGVQHSIHLAEEFAKSGIKVAHIDGETPMDERDKIVNDLRAGRVQVICNCMVLTEGFDCPDLDCAVLARPTKNLGLYLQMGGRVLRRAPGKADTLIIDHSGAIYRHGFLEDDIDWELEPGKLFLDREHSVQKRKDSEPITCEECAHIYTGQIRCPRCGHTPERRGKWYATRHADLVQITPDERHKAERTWTQEEKKLWWGMFSFYAVEKGYKDGWAYHKFREKFGMNPHHTVVTALPSQPSAEFRAYLRHLNIRWAKSKDNPRNKEVANAN